jgi:hypothetical protein
MVFELKIRKNECPDRLGLGLYMPIFCRDRAFEAQIWGSGEGIRFYIFIQNGLFFPFSTFISGWFHETKRLGWPFFCRNS